MSFDQSILFALLIGIFALLIWGKFRYDLVAFSALAVALVAGVVPKEQAFSGFGHPATVIIALVLIVSRGLFASGAIELITRHLIDASRSLAAHISVMSALSAALSAVMNNVAALALLMPVDMQAAQRAKRSPALTLMPLSFASILGGMITLIGTPPNIVIGQFRQDALGSPFGMFDFAPVGLTVAVIGVIYIALIGWRLLPAERSTHNTAQELADLEGYVAEASVPEKSACIGQTVRDLYELADENDVTILGLARRGVRLRGFAAGETIRKGDVLVLEAGPAAIEGFVGAAGLQYAGAHKHSGPLAGTLSMVEVVVPDTARIAGRSAMDLRLLYRRNTTLLGVSRQGKRFRDRVRHLTIRPGDILLLLGREEDLDETVPWLGCLPLAERGLSVAQRDKAWLAVGLFAAAIVTASLGWLYLPVALAACVALYVILRIVPLSQIYDSVEWPVIILLGSLIPIGAALEASGGTALIARQIVEWTAGYSPIVVLTILMIVTMTLSDVLNNVATALIAAPIAVDVAGKLGVNPDPFLMAVAVAASCAFLTPIGHKNNTIIMGPGGYRFGDYWRMGLPLEILVVAIGVPAILFFWPL
ncbi:MAG: SLC13 family permease [Pseudomonadota bacterium]